MLSRLRTMLLLRANLAARALLPLLGCSMTDDQERIVEFDVLFESVGGLGSHATGMRNMFGSAGLLRSRPKPHRGADMGNCGKNGPCPSGKRRMADQSRDHSRVRPAFLVAVSLGRCGADARAEDCTDQLRPTRGLWVELQVDVIPFQDFLGFSSGIAKRVASSDPLLIDVVHVVGQPLIAFKLVVGHSLQTDIIVLIQEVGEVNVLDVLDSHVRQLGERGLSLPDQGRPCSSKRSSTSAEAFLSFLSTS